MVDGRLLTPLLPYGLTIQGGGDELTIHEPRDRALAGSLTLPYLSGRDVRFVELRIPSNGRFTQEDLRLLWDAGAELGSWQKARLAMANDDGTFGAPEVVGQIDSIRDWRSLMHCGHDASALLARWPSALDREQVWQPIGIPGGAEDVPATERFAQHRGDVVTRDGQLVVTQSARWRGRRRPLKSVTISTLAATIVQVVRSSVPVDQLSMLHPLLDPIATVARLATAPAGSRDPDPSSWPTAFITFAASCMRTLADLQSAERGRCVVPFLDTDELYEAWLAIETRRLLDAQFGPWIRPPSDALAAWEYADTLYQLWVRPTISRAGTEIAGATLQAIVAETLTPDLLITATRGGASEYMVIDAKSWATMLPENALEQSAKYLYGIRRADDPRLVPALAGVDLVTCAPRPAISASGLSKVQVVTATPTTGLDRLAQRIGHVVAQLTPSPVDRERPASSV